MLNMLQKDLGYALVYPPATTLYELFTETQTLLVWTPESIRHFVMRFGSVSSQQSSFVPGFLNSD